jgi:hypothetical protein
LQFFFLASASPSHSIGLMYLLIYRQVHQAGRRMADFARAEASEAPLEVLSYAFAPRLLLRGTPFSRTQPYVLTSYPRVSPDDGRTRHRLILGQITTGAHTGVIVHETDPLDWSLESVLVLDRDEMERRGMIHYGFQVGLDVKAVEVPDPVAEGEGRKGAALFLVCTDKGTILTFDGESLDFLGLVNRRKGFVRRLTPYYADAEGGEGARRLRVVASGRGGPCVWDFTDALRGGWEGGREPGVLVHELDMGGEADSSVVGAAYYETSDGGHRWGLRGDDGTALVACVSV